MLLKVGTQDSNALKITLTKFHQHLSTGSQVFKGWDNNTNNNGLLHDQCYVIVLDVNWSSRTKISELCFEIFSKIFKFSFILEQSQICNSNRLKVRARQSELLLIKTFWVQLNCKIEYGNVFIHSYAISKRIKLEWLATWHLKHLLHSFQMVMSFLWFKQ